MTTLNSTLQLALLKQKKRKNVLQKGFTLVELLIVVIILGILSSVALPAFLNQQKKGVISSLNASAMAAAKSCAALQITSDNDQWSMPDSEQITITSSTTTASQDCPNAGTPVIFTANDKDGRAGDATATLGSDGSITLASSS